MTINEKGNQAPHDRHPFRRRRGDFRIEREAGFDGPFHGPPRTPLAAVARDLPTDSAVRSMQPFHRSLRLRAIKNLKVSPAAHVPMTGAMDFSIHGVKARFNSGYAAVGKLLDSSS